jgi:hypothetical protein
MVIRINPFRLVFGSITDHDDQGKVAGPSIIDRDNQATFSSIITKVATSLPTFHIKLANA